MTFPKKKPNIIKPFRSKPVITVDRRPTFSFKDLNNAQYNVFYDVIDGVCYLRAVDVWRALTKATGHFSASHINLNYELDKVQFSKTTGCPSTRPVYAVTIDQALDACRNHSISTKSIHPIETWIREDLAPWANHRKEPKPDIAPPEETKTDPEIKEEPPQKAEEAPKTTETPLAVLYGKKAGSLPDVLSYVLWIRRPGKEPVQFKGRAWFLPDVRFQQKIMWPDRIGIDVEDIRKLIGLDDASIEDAKDRLWNRKDVGVSVKLVDSATWRKFRVSSFAVDRKEETEALDALFALDSGSIKDASSKEPEAPPPATSEPEHPEQPAVQAAPTSLGIIAQRFNFSHNGRRFPDIAIAMDEDEQLWVSRRDLERVFGNAKGWPRPVLNSIRRQIYLEGEPLPAIKATLVQSLAQSLPFPNRAMGLALDKWLAEAVPSLLTPPDNATIDGRTVDFFYVGISHELHVGKDANGDLWAAISDLEALFNLPAKTWPMMSRELPMRLIRHNGARMPAIGEEWFHDIIETVAPSHKNRALAFEKWWTAEVMPMFDPNAKAPEPEEEPQPEIPASRPLPGGKTLTQLARETANLLLQLADESDSQKAEMEKLRAERDAALKAKELVADQAEKIKQALKALNSLG